MSQRTQQGIFSGKLSEFEHSSADIVKARRTAFLARFIVLREGRRSRAHREIELMDWSELTTAEKLAERFREAFVSNGDKLVPVDRDIRRALAHSDRVLAYLVPEYVQRASNDFVHALKDYEESNALLFEEGDEQPKSIGWRLVAELHRELASRKGH